MSAACFFASEPEASGLAPQRCLALSPLLCIFVAGVGGTVKGSPGQPETSRFNKCALGHAAGPAEIWGFGVLGLGRLAGADKIYDIGVLELGCFAGPDEMWGLGF